MSSVASTLTPIIFGCTGHTLDDAEKKFFKDASPAGFILFKKNCDNPQQVTALVNELRACVGWEAPVLIDQEGGRVQRLRPPHWPEFPPPRTFGKLYETDMKRGTAALQCAVEGLAAVQCGMGIDVDCIPVLDVVPAGIETRAIDDRSFGNNAGIVSALGLETARAAIASGITPVMKHMPGHGRATVDSHFDLPRVTTDIGTLASTDWAPFKAVTVGIDNNQIWGMSAHVIYEAIDKELPATLSPTVIRDVIRGAIGFKGLLLTDDLFMEALKPWGDTAARAGAAVKAGCDIALFCHGTVEERAKAAEAVGEMGAETRARLDGWLAARPKMPPVKPVETLLSRMASALGTC